MEGPILLEASKIVKAFPGVWEHLVLDNIDFDLRSGEVHALLGENGAGKLCSPASYRASTSPRQVLSASRASLSSSGRQPMR